MIAADELTAVSNTIDFRYDDGISFLNWPIGQNVDPAVWITLFLALVVTINMFPVKVSSTYGRPGKEILIFGTQVLWRT